MPEVYRYSFQPDISLEGVETSLVLAILATESLHGAAQVRLDVAHYLDVNQRALVIDATTASGCDLNRLLVGFLLREFGSDSFSVQRVNEKPIGPTARCQA